MTRGLTTMSLSNLLQKMHIFTTQVKTNNVPVLSYSTSTLLVVIISLRYNIIPFNHWLLFFLFLLYQNSRFLLKEIDEKSDQKNQYFEKFLACKNGSGEHAELANDAYDKMKGVNFTSNNAQFIYTSLCEVLKCPASSLYNSTLFNFYARTRFTTQVKTNNVLVLNYSSSTLLVVMISLRCNIIPFNHWLLFFLFLLYQNSSFLLKEIHEKSDQKNQYFEKFLACKNGSGEHAELANDAYNKIKGVNFTSNNAQFKYTSLCEVLKCPESLLFNSTFFNFYARTRFWVVYWGSNPKMEW